MCLSPLWLRKLTCAHLEIDVSFCFPRTPHKGNYEEENRPGGIITGYRGHRKNVTKGSSRRAAWQL